MSTKSMSFIVLATSVLLLLGTAHADLVAHWSLDDGAGDVAADSTGNGHDGALIDGPEWAEGLYGGALRFGGSPAKVDVPYSADLNPDEFTVSVWANPDPGGSGHRSPVTSRDDFPARGYIIYVEPGNTWEFWTGTGSGWAPARGSAAVLGEWTHVAGTYKAENLKLYLNGELDSEAAGALGPNTQRPLRIGAGQTDGPGNYFWVGLVDDVAVFNHALTQEEIQAAMLGISSKELATKPIPEDGTEDVVRDSVLSWTPGELADKHDVYFGTGFDDVNNATPADAVYVGRQDAVTYDPGLLTLGQMYFWRVDEVNAAPDNTVFKGATWSFEVEPVGFAVPIGAVSATASSTTEGQDPNSTVNGSGLNENDEHSNLQEDMWLAADTDATPWIQFELEQLQKLEKVHVWNHNTQTETILGFGIKDALIESSLDGASWTEVATVLLGQATGMADYNGEDVDLGGVVARFIRITGLSNYSILGLPQKGLSEVRFYAMPMRARLEIPATGTTGLDPLVDLSWRAGRDSVQHEVLMGTDPNALTLAATVDEPSYTASVDLDSTIYWQINEINTDMDPAVWEGNLWSFDTMAFVTVDDMESYESKEGNWVWETWTDGFGDDGNGALLGHNGDDMETGTVFDGSQSLPYYYGQGGAANSEASRDINRNWGQHGIVSLSLMFYGAESNVAGELYIKVNDTEIATYPVPSDLMIPQWQAWTMDLPAAALGNVQSLAIGVKGGTGVVFVDAIRLYNKASETVVGVTPDDTDLVAHYSFEGDASDASGNGNDGTLEGGPQFVTGKVGQALDFDGVDDYVSTGKVASQLGIDGNKPRTISTWVYTRGFANGGIYDVGARVATEDFSLRTLDDIVDRWRVQYWGGDFDFTFNTLERWVNFTHVHDGTHTKIYADGRLIVDWEKTISTTDTNPFQIGLYGWPGNFFYGTIDEVRVYSRPLSQEEALGLAGRTDPIFKEF